MMEPLDETNVGYSSSFSSRKYYRFKSGVLYSGVVRIKETQEYIVN